MSENVYSKFSDDDLILRDELAIAGVVKASAGAVDHLKIARVTNLPRTIEQLKRASVWVIGVENVPEAREYVRVDYKTPIAIALGSEGAGLSRLVRKKCDLLVRLPMWGKVGPLNVAIAGSIVLHAAKMQRESQNG